MRSATESIPVRCINDIWYRDTMSELGFNLVDMCKWEIDGKPANREGTFVPMPKAGREAIVHSLPPL